MTTYVFYNYNNQILYFLSKNDKIFSVSIFQNFLDVYDVTTK